MKVYNCIYVLWLMALAFWEHASAGGDGGLEVCGWGRDNIENGYLAKDEEGRPNKSTDCALNTRPHYLWTVMEMVKMHFAHVSGFSSKCSINRLKVSPKVLDTQQQTRILKYEEKSWVNFNEWSLILIVRLSIFDVISHI